MEGDRSGKKWLMVLVIKKYLKKGDTSMAKQFRGTQITFGN